MTKQAFIKAVERERDGGSVLCALQIAQEAYGYINEFAIQTVADVFSVSQSHVYGVATFYHQFTFAKRGKYNIQVCMGTACYVLGAEEIIRAIEDELGIKAGGKTEDGLFSLEHNTRCVGDCSIAPIVIIGDKWLAKTTIRKTLNEIRKIKRQEEVRLP
ncbi:MAG: NAD(P)H-dependent oxidoreductase subunit E [Firmicutes bacterium]|nr:NAD(P)H-dependent oxidoreductase subunit E [Bacillota bacterium]